jgi:hypothetical protein
VIFLIKLFVSADKYNIHCLKYDAIDVFIALLNELLDYGEFLKDLRATIRGKSCIGKTKTPMEVFSNPIRACLVCNQSFLHEDQLQSKLPFLPSEFQWKLSKAQLKIHSANVITGEVRDIQTTTSAKYTRT